LVKNSYETQRIDVYVTSGSARLVNVHLKSKKSFYKKVYEDILDTISPNSSMLLLIGAIALGLSLFLITIACCCKRCSKSKSHAIKNGGFHRYNEVNEYSDEESLTSGRTKETRNNSISNVSISSKDKGNLITNAIKNTLSNNKGPRYYKLGDSDNKKLLSEFSDDENEHDDDENNEDKIFVR
jgi:hypothetical protein